MRPNARRLAVPCGAPASDGMGYMVHAAALERDAMAALYREHRDYVLRVLTRLGVAGDDVEDAAQEVFVALQRRLAEYDAARGSVTTWLYGFARGVAANRRRTHATVAVGERVAPEGFCPERALRQQEYADLLEAFLYKRPQAQREVFRLVDMEGRTAPEASTDLDVPINTVYSRLRAARQTFETFARSVRAKNTPAPRKAA